MLFLKVLWQMKNSERSKSRIQNGIVLDALLAYGNDIAIVVAKDFSIETLNSASEKFYKWTLESVHGKNFLELCKDQNISCPIPNHFFKHPELLRLNLDCKNASENDCNLNWIITPLMLPDNEVIGALIIGKDAELKKNNIAYYLNGIIDAIPGCLYWKDCNGYYLGCNSLTAKLAGLSSPYDVIGKTDGELWGEQAASLMTNDKEVITKGKSIIVEEQLKTATGQWMHFTGVKMPLRDENNEIIGLIGNSLDITELKKTQAELKNSMELAEAANQAKTEFLANMRHDVRTPLSGIVGFSEILKQESHEPRIKEYADNLVASSHALLHLMDEVLEAVRVSSGEIPMLKRKFNISDTFNHIMALYAAKAHEKNLALTLTLDPELPNYVVGDKIRLHRIALELIGNALNFTDTGSVAVNVMLAKRENSRVIIKMTVTDTGMGIPKDKQQEIYLQFKRLMPSYQGIYKGAGLGLFVIKQFIDELNGEIYVSSEPLKGSCFTCLIPLQESLLDDDSGMDSDEDKIIEKPYLSPLNQHQSISITEETNSEATTHVLVVEDNGIAQMAAKTLLTAMSCQVDTAANGMDALALCKKNIYDLIFMDIGLGEGLDGYEVTHHIRSMPDTSNTPVIALTAHGGDENKQRCIEAGMDAVLTKPLTQAHAADMLATFIPARRAVPLVEKEPTRRDLPDNDAELFQLGQFALLDSEQALKNCGNQETVVELLSMMLDTEMPRDLEILKQSFANKDYAAIEKLAHKIKGGAVYIGTTRMKYACQYVERYWKAGERELFDALYDQAVNVIEETCLHVKAWLEKQ